MRASRRTLLIAGATGFVGGNLVRRLAGAGPDVNCLVRSGSSTETIRQLAAIPNVRIHTLGDEDGIPEMVMSIRPQLLIHLAAVFVAEHRYSDIGRMIDSNVKFATRLIDAAVSAGTRGLINTGTVWEYYRGAGEYDPVCLYAATKHAFQAVLEYYVRVHDLRVVTLLLADTYGPEDRRNKLVNYIMDSLITGSVMQMSPGDQFLDLVYIDDVVDAYLLALDRLSMTSRGLMPGCNDIYPVISESPCTPRDLVRILAEMLGREPVVEWGARPYRRRELMQAWRSAGRLPGWKPQYSLQAGLKKLIDSRVRA